MRVAGDCDPAPVVALALSVRKPAAGLVWNCGAGRRMGSSSSRTAVAVTFISGVAGRQSSTN